jgi:hypothetical protein
LGKKSNQPVKQHQADLEKKIEVLEKQLEWEKLRTMAHDTMINAAERELNIDIRKSLAPNSPGNNTVQRCNLSYIALPVVWLFTTGFYPYIIFCI